VLREKSLSPPPPPSSPSLSLSRALPYPSASVDAASRRFFPTAFRFAGRRSVRRSKFGKGAGGIFWAHHRLLPGLKLT